MLTPPSVILQIHGPSEPGYPVFVFASNVDAHPGLVLLYMRLIASAFTLLPSALTSENELIHAAISRAAQLHMATSYLIC